MPALPAICGRRRIQRLAMLAALLPTIGCFSERSFPVVRRDVVRLAATTSAESVSTRDWLEQADAALRPLLPGDDPAPLLTADLIDGANEPVDVFEYFDVNPRGLASVWSNLSGITQTAQVTSSRLGVRNLDPWPGFEDVWVPIDEKVTLSGRLGLATRGGEPLTADCIVVLPGLLGENCVLRTRDIALALREFGFHVLALELRGHGRTFERFPETAYTFGTLEVGDLLAVSEWLEDRPEVGRTGLIGFCWGANLAMLAAYEDGRPDEHVSVSPRLRPYLRPRNGRAHFSAGIVAYSPSIRFEEVLDLVDRPWEMLENPILSSVQKTVMRHSQRLGTPTVDGRLRRLIVEEVARSPLTYPEAVEDGLRYLRLIDYKGLPAGDKLEHARVPVLIVHAANDPLAPAQEVADFLATIENPRVAAMILRGGGHDGFASYAREHFYSLLLNYFDPERGAARGGGGKVGRWEGGKVGRCRALSRGGRGSQWATRFNRGLRVLGKVCPSQVPEAAARASGRRSERAAALFPLERRPFDSR